VPYGGGSPTVATFHSISILEGLGDLLGPDVNVQYARGIADLHRMASATNYSTAAAGGQAGVKLETFANNELAGPAADTHIELHIDQGAPVDLIPLALGEMDFSALMSPPKPVSMRWTGFYTPTSAGEHDIFLQFGGFSEGIGHRLFVDDKLIVDRWGAKFAVADSTRVALDHSPHKIVLEYRGESGGFGGAHPFVRLGIVPEGKWVDAATERLAARADAVVLAVGFDTATETEDWDRSFHLPPGQEELIRRISAANSNTIVVVTSGGAVAANDWLERVPALLQAWYPGQEGGRAIAEILFGDVNPSGKLPATFERRWEDNPVHDSYYADPATHRVAYKEGVFVGYRGYERNGTKPLFAFGHGLSYTTFKYDGLGIERQADASYKVSFAVTNTGNRAGAAVPQLYVADRHAKVPRPLKELKGFTKVMLQPGEARTVVIPLDSRAFSYYDVANRRWRADAGTFEILIGSSSDQIELKGEVALPRSIWSK
jgi:beta-glucosidase